jgi:hypothetical protein
MTALTPGDLLFTRGDGFASQAIRFGAAVLDEPNQINHVVGFHHTDSANIQWGIEGRPGGVGWVNIAKYLRNPYTLNNVGQEKSGLQRATILDTSQAMLGVAYDWVAIGLDGALALRIKIARLSDFSPEGSPEHVVCSSLWDWVYGKSGLDNPNIHPSRLTTPGDWAKWSIENHYNVAL